MRFQTLLCLLTCLTFSAVNANNNFTIKTVVIDAGHGGKDPGTIGASKTYEKDVALAVALKLGEDIKKNYPDVNVIYTRTKDVFIELHERAEIANKNKADLFIAIHCNASPNTQVYGSSTYVLGLHRTEANLEVAKRENAVILLEDDRDKNYEFDPNSPEGHIIMIMKQNAFLDQSIALASKTENYLEDYGKRKSLGVKQAGFYVLYKTTMPSILAEIGFLSNPDEEKFLTSAKGQDQVATSLFKAFTEYKREMENTESDQNVYEQSLNDKSSNAVNTAKTDTEPEKKPAPVEPKPVATTKNTTAPVAEKKPVETKQPEPKPVVKDVVKEVVKETPPPADDKYIVLASGKKIRKPAESASGGGATPPKPEPVAVKEPEPVKPAPVETKPAATNTSATKPATTNTLKTEAPKLASASTNGIAFKVQLCALKGDMKAPDRAKADRLFIISTENLDNGFTRFYGGNANTYSEAKRLLDLAKNNGFPTAFIVGFNNGKRMSATEMQDAIK